MRRHSYPHCVALMLLLTSGPASGQSLPDGVAAGDVDQRSVILWARSDAVGPLTFTLATDVAFREIVQTIQVEVADALQPRTVEITDLLPGTAYYYQATDVEGSTSTGRFRTPAALGYRGLRFGVSGDSRGELSPYPSVSNVPDRDLDFFVVLGDTIYADIPSADLPIEQARTLRDFLVKHNEVYRERFGRTWWRDARASTAWFAGIDDHEVTNDFAGGAPVGSDPRFDETGLFLNETRLFQNGLTAFQEYHPIREEFYGDTGDPVTAGKRKIYRFRTFGQDAAVILLDARSFRDDALDPSDFPTTDAFLDASFDPTRTMLGDVQREQLFSDLIECQDRGITWKFVLIPEPIQNLGPVLAEDRFEGYAFERSQVLRLLDDHHIDNVVFVAADIHGTIVNNLVYQRERDSLQRGVAAFEITTGPVAYAAPFGPTVVSYVPILEGFFRVLGPIGQNGFVRTFGNALLGAFHYPWIGLQRSPIDAHLLRGDYLSINTYGWTEFEVDAVTQCLTVTTYGIDWYGETNLMRRRDEVLARRPRVVSRFLVQPKLDRSDPDAPPFCLADPPLCGALGSAGVLLMLLGLTFHRGIVLRVRFG